MADLVIEVEERKELGKNASRRLRALGKIPGIVYGSKFENLKVVVDPKALVRILESETGHNTIFKIRKDSLSANVLIRDYQLDPLRGTLLHADFQTIAMDEVREFEIPIEVVGVPAGVKNEGGTLDFVLREIAVECLPGDLPDHIRVDVSALEIGDAIRVSELQVDTSRVKILSGPDMVVLTVVPPRVEAEPTLEIEEEVAEPEVIRKGKVEEQAEREASPKKTREEE